MSDLYEQLARNLRTAYIAYRMGIKLSTAERNYAGDDTPPSDLWLKVAAYVDKGMMQAIDELVAPKPHVGPVQ